MKNKYIFFFIGTEAELIKLFPIIVECYKQKLPYKVIASGQNDINKSQIIKLIDCINVDLELSKEESIKKSAVGLLTWWLYTFSVALKQINDKFYDVQFDNSIMVVHGDTVSTFMGAKIGKKLGMRVCHVEAGLRSHNIFNPFPEEIDRMLTSRCCTIHFAPGYEAVANLSKAHGIVIDTKHNTLIDSLEYSYSISSETDFSSFFNKKFFIFVIHRQENLANKKLVEEIVAEIERASANMTCVIVLHEITKNTFIRLGILEKLKENNNIILLPRVNYFDFMKLLNRSEYVITDGGSNQEELYYMGKPCLIMRKNTERNEGIGENAVLFDGTIFSVRRFIEEYKKYEKEAVIKENSPSLIIAKQLRIELKSEMELNGKG